MLMCSEIYLFTNIFIHVPVCCLCLFFMRDPRPVRDRSPRAGAGPFPSPFPVPVPFPGRGWGRSRSCSCSRSRGGPVPVPVPGRAAAQAQSGPGQPWLPSRWRLSPRTCGTSGPACSALWSRWDWERGRAGSSPFRPRPAPFCPSRPLPRPCWPS